MRARWRGMKSTPPCPGPPVRATSTPLGASALSAAATARRRSPGVRPEWSSGTTSVEHVKPVALSHGCEPVRRGAGPAGGACCASLVAAAVLVVERAVSLPPPPHPATTAAITARTPARRIAQGSHGQGRAGPTRAAAGGAGQSASAQDRPAVRGPGAERPGLPLRARGDRGRRLLERHRLAAGGARRGQVAGQQVRVDRIVDAR